MIPYLQNCSHNPDGWCLKCVKEFTIEKEKLEEAFVKVYSILMSTQKKLKRLKEESNDLYW